MVRLAFPRASGRADFVELTSALGDPARRNGEFEGMYWCPVHGGSDPCHVWVDQDDRLAAFCFACGATLRDIREALQGGATRPAGTLHPKSTGAIVVVRRRAYAIKNLAGRTVAIHHRLDFEDGSKACPWSLLGRSKPQLRDLPLYGAHDLASYDRNRYLLIVEGETCRDRAVEAGYQCVSLVAGSKIMPSAAALQGIDGFALVLWPDADAGGRAVMAHVARSLLPVVDDIAVVNWSEAPPAGDIVDYLDAPKGGDPHSVDQCDELLLAAVRGGRS